MTTLKENRVKPMKNKSYEERKQTLKKKASELATLCDVPVCLICVNPDGTTETWPEEARVVDVLMAYKAQQTIKNEGKEDEKGKEKVVDKAPEVFETWDTRLEYLPEESLVDVLKILDRQLQAVNRAVGKEQQTGKKRKSLQDEGRSKIVHGVNDDGSQKAGLIRIFFIDSAGLNLTNSCTGNYSDINSFPGRNSEGSSDFEKPVDLELRLG